MSILSARTPFEIPVRRDLAFHFDDTVARHFAGNPYTSHFWNAVSILAPRTEGFLIRAMKQARNDVTDPKLREQADAFLQQEGLHSHHHNVLNARLASLGYDVERASAVARRELQALTDGNDTRGALAFVIAGEYAIYVLARAVLDDPAILAATDSEVRRLIEWHAVEEMEHQSVAYEIYAHLYGINAGDRFRFAGALTKACRVLVRSIGKIEAVLLENEQDVSGAARFEHLKYLFGTPGLAWQVAVRLPRFFAPGFRHWSDRADLGLIETGLERVYAPTRAAMN